MDMVMTIKISEDIDALYGDCVVCSYLTTKCSRINRPGRSRVLMHDMFCIYSRYLEIEQMIGFMNVSAHIDKEIYREQVRKRALKPVMVMYFIIVMLLKCFFANITADLDSVSKFVRSRWRPISLWAWRIAITIAVILLIMRC